MPTLPWTAGPAAPELTDSESVVMASRFELTTFRQVPAFFVAALRVYRQVRRADGAIGVTLTAHPLRREFFTLSSWRDRAAIDAMVRTEPHLSVMNGFRDYTADASFVFWTITATSRPTWKEAHQRLADQSE
ncbi:DUF3291 domain-containing protein [Rhodococcus sp. IEGM 1381]|uniref:DUF3291 domain-containing protein n=1 Tax=Rhodococcus sp. IEGM 1381 TaxID=3047085 RepID=UPI0024B7AD4F|nr:DUF3291 domain-containing protein [Rhodococcus sp. IEGM 1381]MDI9893340.1 DUF3291 domain-containing protein [Rhodococcus sp. IEGM 1381]